MGFSVDLLGAWEIESAYVTQDATICFDLGMANKDPVYADYGTGTASWTPEEAYCPENGITLDVTLTFPPGPEWVPAEDTMAVTGLDHLLLEDPNTCSISTASVLYACF